MFTLSNHKTTNIFKVPEVPKAAVPQKKIPEAAPPKPESPPPEGNNETSQTVIFEKMKCLCFVSLFLLNVSFMSVKPTTNRGLLPVLKVYEEPEEEIAPEEPPEEAVEEPAPAPTPTGTWQACWSA